MRIMCDCGGEGPVHVLGKDRCLRELVSEGDVPQPVPGTSVMLCGKETPLKYMVEGEKISDYELFHKRLYEQHREGWSRPGRDASGLYSSNMHMY